MGEITKKWRGWCAETLTDTDTFKIDFPDNIDVTTKALLMGATMLVVSVSSSLCFGLRALLKPS